MKGRAIMALLVSLTGGLAASQAPELAQQYRQRLGGALDEITQVVADFDADAAQNGLRRDEALTLYARTNTRFLRDRGESMRRIIDRFDHLQHQSVRLEELPPVLRPMAIFAHPDSDVFEGTLRDFEPAVPLTPHGMIWTAAGLLGGFGVFRLLALPFEWRRRRLRHGRIRLGS